MIPERLKNRTHPFPEQRNAEHQGATKQRHDHFQSCVDPKWAEPSDRTRSGDGAAKGEPRHEARKDQGRGPNGISESQTAQPKPERLEKKRASPGEKQNNGDNRDTHLSEALYVLRWRRKKALEGVADLRLIAAQNFFVRRT